MTVFLTRMYKLELNKGTDRTSARIKLKPQFAVFDNIYEANIFIGEGDSLDCRIFLTVSKQNDITVNNFKQIENKIKENSFIKDLYVTEGNEIIITEKLPDFHVSYSKITLNFLGQTEKNISLHDIHKVLDCGILEINGSQFVKDSVLGILLMKRLKTIDYYNFNNLSEWVKIIIKHFEGDKDILECQEELIEKGLKEYAKL